MIVEHVTITRDKLVVSYSGDELSLITPDVEAALMKFWADRVRRIEAEILGLPLGTSSGNVSPWPNVPVREQESQKPPNRRSMFPFGNIDIA